MKGRYNKGIGKRGEKGNKEERGKRKIATIKE